jgi:DNA-binding MarR family transcriptional regulator
MEEIVAPLERAVHAVGLRLAAAGMTQAEAHVLACLVRGPASLVELHRSFGHRRSTLTAVVDRLETKGLVRRGPNPGDRRSVVVALTSAGRPVARRVNRSVAELERQVEQECSAADLAGFARVIAAVTRAASPKR